MDDYQMRDFVRKYREAVSHVLSPRTPDAPEVNKYKAIKSLEAAQNTDRRDDIDLHPFLNIQVAENNNLLNRIVDDYNNTKKIRDKIDLLKKASDSIPNQSQALANWFDTFGRLTNNLSDSEYSKYEAEEIAEEMRRTANIVRDHYIRKY